LQEIEQQTTKPSAEEKPQSTTEELTKQPNITEPIVEKQPEPTATKAEVKTDKAEVKPVEQTKKLTKEEETLQEPEKYTVEWFEGKTPKSAKPQTAKTSGKPTSQQAETKAVQEELPAKPVSAKPTEVVQLKPSTTESTKEKTTETKSTNPFVQKFPNLAKVQNVLGKTYDKLPNDAKEDIHNAIKDIVKEESNISPDEIARKLREQGLTLGLIPNSKQIKAIVETIKKELPKKSTSAVKKKELSEWEEDIEETPIKTFKLPLPRILKGFLGTEEITSRQLTEGYDIALADKTIQHIKNLNNNIMEVNLDYELARLKALRNKFDELIERKYKKTPDIPDDVDLVPPIVRKAIKELDDIISLSKEAEKTFQEE
ncbi:MAG: hypothetical protein ACK4SO_08040, partial [Candidatus Kapaibacteriota bacterium]